MYVEETGTGDGDLRITVEGEDYTAEANYDFDGNGIDETVAVMTDDGFVAYTDADADGHADVMRTIDSQGDVVGQARYEESTGNWVATPPQEPGTGHRPHDAADAESMVLDTPGGEREIGPPTEDTDNDGRADTAIVDTEAGRMMVTDVDGDGSADQVVEISDTGEVTVARHTGEGRWTVVEEGHIGGGNHAAGSDGSAAPDGSAAFAGTEDALWGSASEPAARPWGAGLPGSPPEDTPAQASGARSVEASDPTSDSVWD